jgi:SAM-dependent MidA family methyltransferase
MERCVTIAAGGGFEWVDTPAPDSLKTWVDGFGVDPPTGHQVEVPVGAHDWLGRVTKEIGDAPAVLLLIDYGETARDLVGEPRAMGTLMAYGSHRQDRDVLRDPGTRDITAHVNWTDIARTGDRLGWKTLGYTKQGLFLSELGFVEEVARLGESVSNEVQFAALQAVKEVLLPGGMGETFKVLGLARDLGGETDDPWPGFGDSRPLGPPPRRG